MAEQLRGPFEKLKFELFKRPSY